MIGVGSVVFCWRGWSRALLDYSTAATAWIQDEDFWKVHCELQRILLVRSFTCSRKNYYGNPRPVGLVFKVDGRMSISAVRCHYGVNEFIIHFISRNEDKEGSATPSAKFSCASHCDPFLEKMERAALARFCSCVVGS